MELTIHLALVAVVRGLRRCGVIDDHTLAAITTELLVASEDAAALLHDRDALHLGRLAEEIAVGTGHPAPARPVRTGAMTLRIG